MGFWYHEDFEDLTRYGVNAEKTVFDRHSELQHIQILETRQWGKVLVIDGFFMTSEGEEHYYHEMLVHPAMVTAPRVKRILIIGGGDGGTAREILRHREVEAVTMVEIDGLVVEACREHMPGLGAWDDERLEVKIEDGISFAATAPSGSYDIVFLDGCDPVGPAEGLFTREFYSNCRRLLSAGGIFALQTGSPILQGDLFEGIIRTLGEVFPVVTPCFGPAPIYASGLWSWTLASEAHRTDAPDGSRLEEVTANTKYFNEEIHLGAFAVPNNLRKIVKG